MNKFKLLAIPFAAAVLFTGCAKKEDNKAPRFSGVKDVQCIVDGTVDLLKGVAALDEEDGDVTPQTVITVTPETEVKDGYATFTKTGEYRVNYKVKDSAGKYTEANAFVDVIARDCYKSFSQPASFSAVAGGGAHILKGGVVNGTYILKAEGAEIAEDVALSAVYSLNTGYEYSFEYGVVSNRAGVVKAAADGGEIAEIQIGEGENTIVFTHIVSGAQYPVAEEDEYKTDVEISLYFGALGDDIQLTLDAVKCVRPQRQGVIADNAEIFGAVYPRFEDGAEGACEVLEDGTGATLEVIKTCPQIWLGGMFIDAGVNLCAGVNYKISFDVQSENDSPYEVIIQRGQWNEKQLAKFFNPVGRVSAEISVDGESAGGLWLYVQSGTSENKITVSGIRAEITANSQKTEYFTMKNLDFYETHNDASQNIDGTDVPLYKSELSTDSGYFAYEIENFSVNDFDHKVTGPEFFVSGSGDNYAVTFRAKASAPVELVFAIPVSAGWDPTLAWARITLSEEEKVYTFMCSDNSSEAYHRLVWQFGSAANQRYHNVKIEVWDIQVSFKDNELDK